MQWNIEESDILIAINCHKNRVSIVADRPTQVAP